jgi:hypothetical protein
MAHTDPLVAAVGLPKDSRIGSFYPAPHLADAYAVALAHDTIGDPERLARFLFAQQPAWIGRLMTLRDALVAGLGLKTARQLKALDTGGGSRRVGIFKIYETTPNEVILGEDDRHLDFRVSVLYRPQANGTAAVPQLVVSTVVCCHNRLGRNYIKLIAPFHRRVVQAGLRRASHIGWPTQGTL